MSCLGRMFVKVTDPTSVSLMLKTSSFQASFERPSTELLGATLERVKKSLTKKIAKQKGDEGDIFRRTLPATDWSITLMQNDDVISNEVANKDAWMRATELHFGGSANEKVPVMVNFPTAISLHVRDALATCPITGVVELEFCTPQECTWEWRRARDNDDLEHGEIVSREYVYDVTDDDVGHFLLVTCTPQSRRPDGTIVVGEAVSAATPQATRVCPHIRAMQRQPRVYSDSSDFDVRVITYNFLRDSYIQRDVEEGKYDGDFSNDLSFLETAHRARVFLKELTAHNADIMCLQEVDKHVYEEYLSPHLEHQGYGGVFASPELAFFFRRSTFRLVEELRFDAAVIHASSNPSLGGMSADPEAAHVLKGLDRNTLAVGALLSCTSDPSRGVAAITSHFLGGPRARGARLIQTTAFLEEMHKRMSEHTCAFTPILAADFNSTIDEGVHVLLQEESVSAEHQDWHLSRHYRSGRLDAHDLAVINGKVDHADEGQPFVAYTLTHPFGKLVHSQANAPLRYSYFSFREDRECDTVDFVYFSPRDLELVATLDVLPLQSIKDSGGMPGVGLPSDHVALVADLKWKQT